MMQTFAQQLKIFEMWQNYGAWDIYLLEGKISTFKSLAISKTVHLALLAIVPENIIKELNEIQKKFAWSNESC